MDTSHGMLSTILLHGIAGHHWSDYICPLLTCLANRCSVEIKLNPQKGGKHIELSTHYYIILSLLLLM